MSLRLAEKNRVRSIVINGGVEVLSGVTYTGVKGSHVFQDDVTIIGAQLEVEAEIQDAHSNSDGFVNLHATLTRQATPNDPGVILKAAVLKVWNGLFCIGGGQNRQMESIMFPLGQGIEIDEGEAINLYLMGAWVGTGNLNSYQQATIHYTER